MEYWFGVLEFLYLVIVVQVVFQYGVYVIGGIFWMYGQGFVVVVEEGVYFFVDYVGVFVDVVGEEFGEFEDGQVDFVVVVVVQQVGEGVFQIVLGWSLFWQDVVYVMNGLQGFVYVGFLNGLVVGDQVCIGFGFFGCFLVDQLFQFVYQVVVGQFL